MLNLESTFYEYYKNSESIKDIDPNVWMSKYIIKRMELNEEQILWFIFLNACSYHLPAAYLLINEFPDIELVDYDRLKTFWEANMKQIPFQKDRSKMVMLKAFPETVFSYKRLLNGKSQKEFFSGVLNKTPNENFKYLYDILYKDVVQFGRFTVWNWAQMLKEVAGYKIEPDTLLLGQARGQRSHTHGLCLAFGFEEYTENLAPLGADKKFKVIPQDVKEQIEKKTAQMITKFNEQGIECDLFTIETVACAFKKLFRKSNSRYLGYYLDRQALDIEQYKKLNWYGVDWELLDQAREEMLQKEFINQTVDKQKYLWEVDKKISFLNEPEIDEFIDDWK